GSYLTRNRYRYRGVRRDRAGRPFLFLLSWRRRPSLALVARRTRFDRRACPARAAGAQSRPGGPLSGRLVSDGAAAGAIRRNRHPHAERRLSERSHDPAPRDLGVRLADLLSVDPRITECRAVMGAARVLP